MTKQECIELLRQVSRKLQEAGDPRYPKRSDFSPEAVVAIKAHLGPWPRALEAAGLKPPREDDRITRNREKRIRAKRRRRDAMKREASIRRHVTEATLPEDHPADLTADEEKPPGQEQTKENKTVPEVR